MNKYLLTALGALFIALCVTGYLLKNSYEKVGELETRNKSLELAIHEQQALIAQKNTIAEEYEAALFERETQITALNKKNKEANNAINELRKDNQVFKDWGDELLPIDVIGVLKASRADSN